MRHKTLTIAVVALLAFGASGVVSASLAPNHSTNMPTQSPVENALSGNHTVEVIDPDDRLDERAATDAWQTAWANETVRDHFEDGTAVHFHVEAVGDELQVYVAADENSPPRVEADVDLNNETVVGVEVLHNVATAEDVETMDLAPINASEFAPGEPVTLNVASDNDTVTVDSSEMEDETYETIDSVGNHDGEYTVEVVTDASVESDAER